MSLFIFDLKRFVMIFYFSGTGNSKYVAKEIAAYLNLQLFSIAEELKDNKLHKYGLTQDSVLGFVFPVYSWGVPVIVLNFIKKAQFSNYKNQYVFFVCTCGDDTGLTPSQVRQALSHKSIHCNAGFSVIMPNNYIVFPYFNVDSPHIESQKLKNAPGRIRYISQMIDERKNIFDCHEGNLRFIKSRIINPLFNKFLVKDSLFYATEECISCKICEKLCPIDNIVVNIKPQWQGKCIQCLACLHYCPTRAIQYGNLTLKKGRYHFPINR